MGCFPTLTDPGNSRWAVLFPIQSPTYPDLDNLKVLRTRLKASPEQRPSYEQLLMRVGADRYEVGRVSSLVNLTLPQAPTILAKRQLDSGHGPLTG